MKILPVAALLIASACSSAETVSVKITRVQQETPVWCWAACLQMALKSEGVEVSQPEIATAIFGQPKARTAWLEINNFLKKGGTIEGKRWTATARFSDGPLSDDEVVAQLKKGRPVVVAYNNTPVSGHAVVLFGAKYAVTDSGVVLSSVSIYDPFENKDKDDIDARSYRKNGVRSCFTLEFTKHE